RQQPSKIVPMRFMVIVGVLLAVVLVSAGCGKSKEDKAMSDICSARDDINKQVDKLKGLTVTTATKSDVTDSLKLIRGDLSKIAGAAGDLSEQRRKEVQDANQAFTSAATATLRELGTTLSIDNARAQLKAAFDQLAKSYR